jgi:hypothetical protein
MAADKDRFAPMNVRTSRGWPMHKTITVAIASLLLPAGVACAQGAAPAPFSPGAVSVGAEALAWWFSNSPTPTPIIADDVFGPSDTRILLGGGDVDTGTHGAVRVKASYAPDARFGVEGNFLYVDRRSKSAGVQSSGAAGSTDLLLPFFDVTDNRENVTEISFSPVYGGSAQVELESRLMGAELNATWAAPSAAPWRVKWLAGFRFMQLEEKYTITTSSSFIPPLTPDIWITTDRFETTNDFYGAQVGADARYEADRWFASGSVKVGLGAMVQKVDISGGLVTDDFSIAGPPQAFAGGYFALPTNIGSRTRTTFAVVPEVQLSVGYRITPSTSLYLSYSFLYASDVVRPGNQIDRNINPTQSVSYTGEPPAALVGPARPSSRFDRSDFWAQGVGVGIEVRF